MLSMSEKGKYRRKTDPLEVIYPLICVYGFFCSFFVFELSAWFYLKDREQEREQLFMRGGSLYI